MEAIITGDRTPAISGPRPLTKLQPDSGIAGPLHRVVLTEAHMKAQVTEDAAGLHFEIKDDGSAEYQKAAQLTREVNEREERSREAMRQPGGSFMHFVQGDEAALRIIVKQQRAKIERLKDAIRRIADQDATLSACDGNVTVQVDGSLTDDERKTIDRVIFLLNHQADDLDKSGLYDYSASHRKDIAALRTLSERLG